MRTLMLCLEKGIVVPIFIFKDSFCCPADVVMDLADAVIVLPIVAAVVLLL